MKRDPILFLAALFALLGSVLAAFATLDARDHQLRGYVNPVQESRLPFRVPRLGVNAALEQYTPAELAAQLERMETAHVTWVRQFIRWDEIEPAAGDYRWQTWDTVVQAVDAHPNLQLVAVLVNTPAWARHPQADRSTAPPQNPADFAAFVQAFATRYGQTIDFYQIWDEPNLADAWGGLEPRPADYVALLKEAYFAIHGADANATVIVAALAPTTETGPRNISDIRYLRALYALGAQPYFDAAAAKPYGFDLSPDDRTVDESVLNFSRIVALREEMAQNGDGAKALWASHWGWNSLPADWRGQPSIWGNVSADEQITYTLAALDRADREWPWLAGMILQHWQPPAAEDDPLWGFALIAPDGSPTSLYQSLAARPRANSAENGLFAPVNPYAQYSGVWTFGRMGADIGWLQDSQLQFTFAGSEIALLLREDDYTGYLYLLVDGQPANAVPRDSAGNAYVVLTSGSLSPELRLVPAATRLTSGQHLLHVRADRGWDRWALAGYAVSSGNLAEPYDRQILLAWVTAVIAGAAAIITGWRLNWRGLFAPFTQMAGHLGAAGQLAAAVLSSMALLTGMFLTWSDGTPAIFRREPVQIGLAFITAGFIYLEPGFILTILAALLLLVFIYNRLELGLMLTLFWSPFFLFPVELYQFAFPLAEVLILVTTAAWLLHTGAAWGRARQSAVSQFPTRLRFPRLRALDYGLIAWFIVGLLSLIWAEYRAPAVTELRTLMLEPLLFYAILRTIALDKRTIIRLADTLVAAGFAVAFIGLFMFIQGQSIITAEAGAQRLASVYGSPNNVGLFLGRCLPFALVYAILPLHPWRRALAAAALGIMSLAIILSQSVGALFIGVPAAVIVVLVLAWGKRAYPILAALALAALVAFVFSMQSPRFARVLDFSSGTNFYRLRVWESAINLIRDHPLTGVGLDQFLYAFRGYYILPDAWQEPNLSHPHNFILDFWVRLGIFGVIILVAIQAAFWRQASRICRTITSQSAIHRAIVIGIIGSMVNLLAHGLIDNSVYVQDLAYIFVFLIGAAVRLSNIRAIDEPEL
ncbi:MAG: O-antigen ligase family protein [Chloroflexi bacterium]|nr:O-antigen ligase family protein [Chloroflexota bacterium]